MKEKEEFVETASDELEQSVAINGESDKKDSKLKKNCRWMKNNWEFYVMLLPGFASLIVFSILPMFGLYLAFVDYTPSVSIWESEFVGFLNFELIFQEDDPKHVGFIHVEIGIQLSVDDHTCAVGTRIGRTDIQKGVSDDLVSA